MQTVNAQIHVWDNGPPGNQVHWQITSFSTEEAAKMTGLKSEGVGRD